MVHHKKINPLKLLKIMLLENINSLKQTRNIYLAQMIYEM